MVRFVLTLTVLLVHALYFVEAIDVQCQWPCPRESDVCQVITAANGWFAQCLPLGLAQWVLVSPESDPVFYTKHPSMLPVLGEPCHLPPVVSASVEKCADGFTCTRPSLPFTQSTCTLSRENLHRREIDSNVNALDHHSTAFNVVHLIAAGLGIVCAMLVGITVFIMCRRRRRIIAGQQRQTVISVSTCSQIASMDRFHQFAQDYCHDYNDETRFITPLPEAHTDKKSSINSPIMQQIRLHRQLIEQHQTQSPPPYQP